MGEKQLARLERRGAGLIEDIKAAFRYVGRGHGVSWSETFVLDDYGTMEERLGARARDTDRFWTDLIDDPNWTPDQGYGGFSFLDEIGFRYYLPPAMIRTIKTGVDQGIEFHLIVPPRGDRLHGHKLGRFQGMSDEQHRCIARFVKFMMDLTREKAASIPEESGFHQDMHDGWREVYSSYWHQFV